MNTLIYLCRYVTSVDGPIGMNSTEALLRWLSCCNILLLLVGFINKFMSNKLRIVMYTYSV